MAQKKSVSRLASTPSSKKPSVTKKKTVTFKSAATKKQVKASTALGKQKAAQKLTSGKKTVGSKKTVATKAKPTSSKGVSAKKPALKKTTTKKNVVKTALKPKAKKPAAQKPSTYKKKISVAKKTTVSGKASNPKSVVTKQEGSVSKKNAGSTIAKKVVTKAPSRSVPSPTRSAETKTGGEPLSLTERYNLGGLFVCAIERANDPESKRLRAVLRHLDLPSQEKDNLLRLSQGFTIPKLFADGVGEDKVSQILTDFIRFALAEGAYEKKWRDEIRQVGVWLGYFPQQFEQIEQKVLAKR